MPAFPSWRSPDVTTTATEAADIQYYSFIDPERMKGWVGLGRNIWPKILALTRLCTEVVGLTNVYVVPTSNSNNSLNCIVNWSLYFTLLWRSRSCSWCEPSFRCFVVLQLNHRTWNFPFLKRLGILDGPKTRPLCLTARLQNVWTNLLHFRHRPTTRLYNVALVWTHLLILSRLNLSRKWRNLAIKSNNSVDNSVFAY